MLKSNLIKSILVGAAIFGAALTASAQGAGKVSVHDISFSMATLKPANPELGLAAETIEVGLLLPAVQKVREAAARIHVQGEGWDIWIPVFGRSDRTSVKKMTMWVVEAAGSAGEMLILNIKDPAGELRQLTIPSGDVAINIVSAMELPSSSAKHHSHSQFLMGDGSVRGILIGLLLPAVQKVR